MNNLFIAVGRITKDLELRYTKDNKAVLDINIALNNDKDDTTFLKVTIWNKIAETTAKYCKKGDLIGVSGLIKNHNWEDEKGKHYEYNFIGNRVQFLSTKANEINKELKENNTVEINDPFEEFGNQIEVDDNFLD